MAKPEKVTTVLRLSIEILANAIPPYRRVFHLLGPVNQDRAASGTRNPLQDSG